MSHSPHNLASSICELSRSRRGRLAPPRVVVRNECVASFSINFKLYPSCERAARSPPRPRIFLPPNVCGDDNAEVSDSDREAKVQAASSWETDKFIPQKPGTLRQERVVPTPNSVLRRSMSSVKLRDVWQGASRQCQMRHPSTAIETRYSLASFRCLSGT